LALGTPSTEKPPNALVSSNTIISFPIVSYSPMEPRHKV
jgi:hypothetical protein